MDSELLESLLEITKKILALPKIPEAELLKLQGFCRKKMDTCTTISEWEEAMILYFLVNGYRVKNIQFMDALKKLETRTANPLLKTKKTSPIYKKPDFTLIK
ncbi:MAG: hypothetical protein LBF22_06455 [Deltaproteobacteria bacterium]|jgi:hypothetical protein|nr:hypothetical protein [Deltaproteobacteria bacterium]